MSTAITDRMYNWGKFVFMELNIQLGIALRVPFQLEYSNRTSKTERIDAEERIDADWSYQPKRRSRKEYNCYSTLPIG